MSANDAGTAHFSLSLASSVVVFAIIAYAVTIIRTSNSRLPGPWYSRWTSIVLTWYWLRGERAYYVHDLHSHYGPVVRLSPSEVSVSSADDARVIYHLRETFVKAPFYRNVTSAKTPNLFDTADVQYHRQLRKLLGGPMAASSLRKFEQSVVNHVNMAVRVMREEMSTRGAVDVWQWWTYMATDIISELSFGESFKTLEHGKPSTYTEDLARNSTFAAIRSTFPSLIPLTDYLPLPFLVEARQGGLRRKTYARTSLERYQRLIERDPIRARQMLFTHMMKAKDDESLSMEELVSNAMAYIVAGTDTTANTLTYLVWELCRHPDMRAALVDELRGLPQDYTDEHLRDLGLLSNAIQESLRLHSAAPSCLPRLVPAEGAVLGGFRVDGGSTVSTQAYTAHRDASAFPDPESFVPSRWETPSQEMKDLFMPFGRGGRICLGMHLAQMELRHSVARFFLEFPEASVSNMNGMSDATMRAKIYFLISPAGRQCLIQETKDPVVRS